MIISLKANNMKHFWDSAKKKTANKEDIILLSLQK